MPDRGRTVTARRSPPVGGRSYRRLMRSREPNPIDRLAGIGLSRPDPGDLLVLPDGHLHSEDDSICPRCLTWIEERHFVRRTIYGVLQHEVCPRREDD